MGRPIHKKFFGNTNVPAVGGEAVATVTIASPIAGNLAVSTTSVAFSSPQLAGGTVATGTAVIDANGDLTGVTLVNAGGGYTSVPTITVTDSDDNEVITLTNGVNATIALTSSKQNAITISAFVPGGSSAVVGDIVKQESSRRYLVTTAQGTGQCRLVSAAPAAGEMTLTAVDSAGGTYYVTKLTARRALLIKGNRTGTQFTSGTTVPWTLGSAVLNQSVQILSA